MVSLQEAANWAGGFKTVYVIIPVIVLVMLFYPNVSVDSKAEHKVEESKSEAEESGSRMPLYAILLARNILPRLYLLERLVSEQLRLYYQ